MRFLPAGSQAVLVEVGGLDEALALFASLRDEPVPGVVELVPAARTVLVRFDPAVIDPAHLVAEIRGRPLVPERVLRDDVVEIPVHYDGEDLVEVARHLGVTEDDVIRKHTRSTWTVAFIGFSPGFAYLAGSDPSLDVPRRAVPRHTVPAGSVGLAGRYSGVYPRSSPGGWQLIGRTDVRMWDLGRAEPALVRPGMRVRFVDAGDAEQACPPGQESRPAQHGDLNRLTRHDLGLDVLATGPLAVLEDLGRPGLLAMGVSGSGAMDRGALGRANRLVGNPHGAAALELSGGGVRLRARGDLVLALAGAPAPLSVHTSDGSFDVSPERPFALDDGEELVVGAPSRGAVSYLGVRGRIAREHVLGSVSTDLLSGIGAPLRPGDFLPVASGPGSAVDPGGVPLPPLPSADDVVEVDVILGPRADWFTATALEVFTTQEWSVTPRSNRVGLRLAGDVPLERTVHRELPSEGTLRGALQVPPNGQPVLFTADHPVTGGYPVIGYVAQRHLDLVSQAPVGCRLRFRPVPSPFGPGELQ